MLGEPRLSRWHNINKLQIWSLIEEIESAGDTFLWRPYALALKNWEFPKFYSDNERWVCLNSEIGDEILSFAWCLRPCELVGMDCLEQYLPHRVGMQFGMDQDIPDSLPRSNGNLNDLASSSYDLLLDGWKLYLSPRAINGKVTVQYCNWWRKTEELFDDLDGHIGGEDDRAPPCSSTLSPFTEIQLGKSSTEGSGFMGQEGDIGKGKHIGLEEDHQEPQKSDTKLYSRSNSQIPSLKAGNKAGESPPQEIVIIDDDDDGDDNNETNDRVSRLLALISSIEARIGNLQRNVPMLERRS